MNRYDDNTTIILAAAPCKAVFLPDSPKAVIETANNPPELENVQGAVGNGLVEVVDCFNIDGVPVQVMVNEEGRLKGMRGNIAGTAFLQTHCPRWKTELPLVGPVVVLAGDQAVWK